MFCSVFTNSVIKTAVSIRFIKPRVIVKQQICVSTLFCRSLSSSVEQLHESPNVNSLSTELANNASESYLKERYPVFTNINYEEITGNDEELQEKLKAVVRQMHRMAGSYQKLPTHIKLHQWHELLNLRTFTGRFKYLRFLFLTEMKRSNAKKRKAKRRALREEMLKQKVQEPEDPNTIVYSLNENSLFLRIYDRAVDHFYNFRALQGMMFGSKLVIDCSYDEFMVKQEIVSCSRQLENLFACNRTRTCPLDLHFVNFDPESALPKRLQRDLPKIYESHFPLNWSPKSYLDLFPKEKLVYLTPHCEEILETINPDDIYIIGAIVDRGVVSPLSLTKAKQAGIRHAKLPLDKYLKWGRGGKLLTIDQCANIVGDAIFDGSWERALKTWVPRRKLERSPDEMMAHVLKNIPTVQHVRESFKRNVMLFDFMMKERNGEKTPSVTTKWPQ